MNETLINIGMYVTYGLLGLAALSAILFSIYHMFGNIRKAVPALIGLGVRGGYNPVFIFHQHQ